MTLLSQGWMKGAFALFVASVQVNKFASVHRVDTSEGAWGYVVDECGKQGATADDEQPRPRSPSNHHDLSELSCAVVRPKFSSVTFGEEAAVENHNHIILRSNGCVRGGS